jgi:hypothetical protein
MKNNNFDVHKWNNIQKADNWLTENKTTSQSKINENDRVYGGSNIKNLYNDLKDDEHVHLDDSSGELSGAVVSKMEYVKRMLKSAIREENWSKVEDAIFFIDTM